MSCIVTLFSRDNRVSRPVVRGTEPRKPTDWQASAWFVLPNGEKHTHSATARGETVTGLVAYMGALIDSLIADHGNQVASAGWTATTHGRRKK
jgi:hypothetical protein